MCGRGFGYKSYVCNKTCMFCSMLLIHKQENKAPYNLLIRLRPNSRCLQASILNNVQHNHRWAGKLKLAEKDDRRYMLLCCVFVVIKSERFIEWRLSPYFLLSSTKSAVFSNAGSGLMWLMKARCGSPQRTHFLSSEKLRVTVLFYKQTNWSVVFHEIPFMSPAVHTVLSNTLV